MKTNNGVMNLFPGMSKEESDAFQRDLFKSIRMFKCGTPFRNELYRAVKAFHAGEPVSQSIAIEEIILNVLDDWRETGHKYYPDGTDEIIYTPRINVEDGEEEIRMLSKEDIKGFVPVRGHSYRIRVRRFQIVRKPSYNSYELLEVLSDIPTVE